MHEPLVIILIVCVAAVAGLAAMVRARHVDRWIGSYVASSGRRGAPPQGQPVHLLLCIADHFEPRHGGVSAAAALARVRRWALEYPRLFSGFRDSEGVRPRHTFFYPLEAYDSDEVQTLAELCAGGYGEVEVHLHHEDDTAADLRRRLTEYTQMLALHHGLLARRGDGRIAYGFAHGNWALDNSRPDGRWCGVNSELEVLVQTGCYADFTFPSAPDVTQPQTINSIYWAIDDPDMPKSHDRGIRLDSEPPRPGALLMVQGPLLLGWRRRKYGVLPRIENGCLQASQPPDPHRLDLWLKARVQVPGRPDWYFVKLHTHGAPEANQGVLLGEAMVRFHRALASRASRDRNFSYSYVSARQMFNLARAAAAGYKGPAHGARDYELTSPLTLAASFT